MQGFEGGESVRKLRAPTYDAAKKMLFDMYKTSYFITDKRQVLTGGFFGGLFGQKEEVEVSYVIRERSADEAYTQSIPIYKEDNFIKSRDELLTKAPKIHYQAMNSESFEKSIQKLEKNLTNQIQSMISTKSGGENQNHPTIERIEKLLVDNDFSLAYIKEITDRVRSEFSLERLEDFDYVERAVIDWIGESIHLSEDKLGERSKVSIIVGPTGVGKTTTLVKLAATYHIAQHKAGKRVRLCFVTTDTVRVGAMEQLDRFSEVFGSSVLKAEKAEALKKIYDEYKDQVDAFFIDTSGSSPNNAMHIARIKNIIDIPSLNPTVYLAFMASTKGRDIRNIIQNYEPFAYKSIIVTKCDESEQYGNVISAVKEKHKEISFVTSGQNAAKGIGEAKVVDFLVRLEGFKVDRVHIEDKFGDK